MRVLLLALLLSACSHWQAEEHEKAGQPMATPLGAQMSVNHPDCPITPECVCRMKPEDQPDRIRIPEKLRAKFTWMEEYWENDCDKDAHTH